MDEELKKNDFLNIMLEVIAKGSNKDILKAHVTLEKLSSKMMKYEGITKIKNSNDTRDLLIIISQIEPLLDKILKEGERDDKDSN